MEVDVQVQQPFDEAHVQIQQPFDDAPLQQVNEQQMIDSPVLAQPVDETFFGQQARIDVIMHPTDVYAA